MARSQIEGQLRVGCDAVTHFLSRRAAGIIEALVSAANDKEDEAQRAIFTAVVDIARKKHMTVLNMCHAFLVKHTKVSLPRARDYTPQYCIEILCNTIIS